MVWAKLTVTNNIYLKHQRQEQQGILPTQPRHYPLALVAMVSCGAPCPEPCWGLSRLYDNRIYGAGRYPKVQANLSKVGCLGMSVNRPPASLGQQRASNEELKSTTHF